MLRSVFCELFDENLDGFPADSHSDFYRIGADIRENGIQLGSLKDLAGIIEGGAGKRRRPASDSAVGLFHLLKNLFAPAAEHAAQDHFGADEHDDRRDKQFPEDPEVQDALAAEQQ